MAFLLWLLVASRLITFWQVGPHYIPSTVTGTATKPLVILVRADECRAIGISVDGPQSYLTQRPMEPGLTLRVEYPHLTRGAYFIALACLDGGGGILQLVDAGSVEVI